VGTVLYRNRDQEFERQLEKKSAERRIRVWLQLATTDEGYALTITDEDGICAWAALPLAHETAQNAEKAATSLRENLGKLGSTIYEAVEITLPTEAVPFIPASAANGLRREAVEALDTARAAAYQRPTRSAAMEPPVAYPETELSYLGNVFNDKARAFYTKHGVQLIDAAYEANEEKGEVSLMITKHCLRYSFNLCPKEVKGIRPDPMTLQQGKDKLTLKFDCKKCEMHVMGKMRKHRPISLIPVKAAH